MMIGQLGREKIDLTELSSIWQLCYKGVDRGSSLHVIIMTNIYD